MGKRGRRGKQGPMGPPGPPVKIEDLQGLVVSVILHVTKHRLENIIRNYWLSSITHHPLDVRVGSLI